MTAFTMDSLPKRTTSTSYQVALLTDLGNISGSDWDDHLVFAVLLCTQDKFTLRYVATDNSDAIQNNQGQSIDQLYDAYESDLVGGTLPAVSLTRKQLQSITCLGALGAPPSTGYRVSGDADYARVHNCSQRFIKMARDCGDPSGSFQSNPYGKLWVSIGGGYGVFAQILREAITGGELTNILDRCVFWGCPLWNAFHTQNAWAYWTNNCYFTNASTPGIFGATQMFSIYPAMEAIMSTNDAAQQAAWATMKTQGAMGAHCEARRLVSTAGTLNVPRAGEATVMQYWLLEAERLGSWDPTNTSNGAGNGFVLYNNNNWPYLHSPAGFWAVANWPTTETEFSPSHWGTRLAVDTQAECTAAFDMTGYRTWLTTNWARYA